MRNLERWDEEVVCGCGEKGKVYLDVEDGGPDSYPVVMRFVCGKCLKKVK